MKQRKVPLLLLKFSFSLHQASKFTGEIAYKYFTLVEHCIEL